MTPGLNANFKITTAANGLEVLKKKKKNGFYHENHCEHFAIPQITATKYKQ